MTPILKGGKTVIPDQAIQSVKRNTVALKGRFCIYPVTFSLNFLFKGPLATPSMYSRHCIQLDMAEDSVLQLEKVTFPSILLSDGLSTCSPMFVHVPLSKVSKPRMRTLTRCSFEKTQRENILGSSMRFLQSNRLSGYY